MSITAPPLRSSPHLARVQPLDRSNLSHVLALYAHGGAFTPQVFTPDALHSGLFVGLFDEQGELEAVGGTHIVNHVEQVAALGHIYTRPDCRGRGYAAAITGSLVTRLQQQGIR